jgi:hypothetical protein|tara:strand:+ start:444 stop:617 length:174 start_codon:yes stop_codon:yes gene_type:complete
MLKAELEKWKEDTEKELESMLSEIDGKSMGDIKIENLKSVWTKIMTLLGRDIPKDSD